MQIIDIICKCQTSKTEIELHRRYITVLISSISHVSKIGGISFIPLSREKSSKFSHQLVTMLFENAPNYEKRNAYFEIPDEKSAYVIPTKMWDNVSGKIVQRVCQFL